MFIRIWYPCIIFSCIAIPCLVAKPFSLNEAIAAEEKQKRSLQTTSRPKLSSEYPEKILLNKAPRFNPPKLRKPKTDSILPRGKKILSLLNYKKKFQIRSPLKPKKLKYIHKARNKRKNQYLKRQINDDEKILRKYVPLLKSLSLLFDNMLDRDSTDSPGQFEKRQKYRKLRNTSRTNNSCTCTGSDGDAKVQESAKETIISTTPLIETTTVTITAETPTTTTDYTTLSDVSGIRQNPDVSLLLARNSTSAGGNDTGLSEGSSSSFHTSIEGYISRNNRDGERDTGGGEDKSNTEDNEENTDSYSRNGPSGDGFRRGLSGDEIDIPSPVYRGRIDEASILTENADDARHTGRNFNEFEGKNKFEVRRNKAESPEFLQQSIRELGGGVPENNVFDNSESIQPKKSDEESYNSVSFDIADDQRLPVRNGTSATKDQEAGPKNAAVISITDLNNPIIMLQNSPKHKAPFVTIIDGYSVARDKNGPNKIAEQSIRFNS